MDEMYIRVIASYVEEIVSDDDVFNSVGFPNYSGSGMGRRDMEWVFLPSEHAKATETVKKLNDIPGLTVEMDIHDPSEEDVA